MHGFTIQFVCPVRCLTHDCDISVRSSIDAAQLRNGRSDVSIEQHCISDAEQRNVPLHCFTVKRQRLKRALHVKLHQPAPRRARSRNAQRVQHFTLQPDNERGDVCLPRTFVERQVHEEREVSVKCFLLSVSVKWVSSASCELQARRASAHFRSTKLPISIDV